MAQQYTKEKFEIIGINPDVQDVYEEVLKKLSEKFKENEEIKEKEAIASFSY